MIVSGSYQQPQIDTLSLVSHRDTDSSLYINSISLDVSVPNLSSMQTIENARIRIAVANEPHCAEALDFITQRSNEYRKVVGNSIDPYDYAQLIREYLGSDKFYYNPRAPFSPFSVDMPAMQYAQVDRQPQTGDSNSNSILPPGTTIYDIPLVDQVLRDSEGGVVFSTDSQKPTVVIETIKMALPSGEQKISQLSCYMFLYTPLKVKDSSYSSLDAMSIVTDMSLVSTMVPIGKKTLYVQATESDPYPNREVVTTLRNPDSGKNFITKNNLRENSLQEKITLAKKNLTKLQMEQNSESNQPALKIVKDSNFFSDLWLSKDEKEDHRFSFSYDLRSFLAEKSPYNFLYRNESTARALLEEDPLSVGQDTLSKVSEIEVYRQNKEIGSYGLVGDSLSSLANVPRKPEDSFPVVVLPTPTAVSLDLRGSQDMSGMLFYEGVDSFSLDSTLNQQISGKFLYGVNVAVYDGALEYLRQMLNSVAQAKTETKSIQDYISSGDAKVGNSRYSPQTGKTTKSVKSIEIDLGYGSNSVYGLIRDRLLQIQPLLEAATGIENIGLVDAFDNDVRATNGKMPYSSFSSLLEMYSELYFMIENYIIIQSPKNPSGTSLDIKKTQLQHNSNAPRDAFVTRHSHLFWDVYDRGNNFGFGADYLFENTPSARQGLNSMSFLSYGQRQQDEFRKYFKNPNGSAAVVPAGSYLEPSLSYFTAKIIKTPGKDNIVQTNFTDQQAASTNYPMNKYGELLSDIIKYNLDQVNKNTTYGYLEKKPSDANSSNFIGNSVANILVENFSVTFPRESPAFFRVPTPVRGDTPVTVESDEQSGCDTSPDSNLIPSIVGGANTSSPPQKETIKTYESNIKDLSLDRKMGYTDLLSAKADKNILPIKLPFLIMGELSIGQNSGNNRNYNSLTALKNFLNIPSDKVVTFLEDSYISSFPNQVKSMLAFAASDEKILLGGQDGSPTFEACRPKLKERNTSAKSDSTISFYGDLVDMPPYPRVLDPMKSYAQFLAFWLNYKQISVIEYLHGFSPIGSSNQQKNKLTNWKRLDAETVNYMSENIGKKLLCRVRHVTPTDYLEMVGDALTETQKITFASFFENKEALSLPIYNKYFYFEGPESPIDGGDVVFEGDDVTAQSNNITSELGIGVSANELRY
jgi:hypothetical protein